MTIKDLGLLFYLRHVRGRHQSGIIYCRAEPDLAGGCFHHRNRRPYLRHATGSRYPERADHQDESLRRIDGMHRGISLILASTHATGQASSLEGNLMIIVSAFVYSIYLVLSKPLSLRYSAVTMMKWMFLFSTLVLLPFTYRHVLDTPAFQREILNMQELGAICFVLIGATFIPYLLIPMSLKRIRPTTVSMYNYIQPIIASLIAVMIGQDTFSLQKVLSAALVFAGVYLVTQSKSRADLEKESR